MPLSSMYKKECVQNLGEAQTAALHLGQPNSDLGPICILCKGSGKLWSGVFSDPCPLCEDSMEIKDSEANASVQEGLKQMEPVGEPFRKVVPVTSLRGLRQELIVDSLPESESKPQHESTNASEQFDIHADVDIHADRVNAQASTPIQPSDTSVIARWDFDWDPSFPNENSERDTANLPMISPDWKQTKRMRRRPRRRGLDPDSRLATHEISSAASLAVASVSGGEDISMNSSPLNSNNDCPTSVELNANAQDSLTKAHASAVQSVSRRFSWADLEPDEGDWITPGSRPETNVQQSYWTTPASNGVPLFSFKVENTFLEAVQEDYSLSDLDVDEDLANTGRSTVAECLWDTSVRSGASSSHEAPIDFGDFEHGELEDQANTGRSPFAEGQTGASSSHEAPTHFGDFTKEELEAPTHFGDFTKEELENIAHRQNSVASSFTAVPDCNEDTTAPPESSRTIEVSSPKASSSTAIFTDGVVGASPSRIVLSSLEWFQAEAAKIVATGQKDREELLQARQQAQRATTQDALQAVINAQLAKSQVGAPDLSYSHCQICRLEYRAPEPHGGMCCDRSVQDGRSVQAVALTPTSAGTDEPSSFGLQATPMNGIRNYPNPHNPQWEAQFEAGGQDAEVPQANISANRGNRTKRKARKGLNVAEELRTTVMMRGIPNNYNKAALLRLLFSQFSQEKIDLVYLPLDYAKNANLGYAFVNLTSHEAANEFYGFFQGFGQWDLACEDNWGRFSGKICEVTWSDCQGLDANIENYRNCSAMHSSVPVEGKPILLINGEEIEFPPPTRKVRAPYRSTKA